jgi:hypothetical protein
MSLEISTRPVFSCQKVENHCSNLQTIQFYMFLAKYFTTNLICKKVTVSSELPRQLEMFKMGFISIQKSEKSINNFQKNFHISDIQFKVYLQNLFKEIHRSD